MIIRNVCKYPSKKHHVSQDLKTQQQRCENHPETVAGLLLAFTPLGSCVRSQYPECEVCLSGVNTVILKGQ